MTNQETAHFISFIGFFGFAALTTYLLYRTVEDGLGNQKRLIAACGLFVTMFGGISAISQVARAPLEWLTLSQAAQAQAVLIWVVFVFAAALLVRVDDEP
jgi:hypothetical protein